MALSPTPLEAYFDQRVITLMEAVPGRRVPLCFSDSTAEHLATRRAAGLFDFSFMSCVEVKGNDSRKLLNAVQTRDLAQLPIGRIRYTLLVRDDGTVVNDATVWRMAEDEFLLFAGRHDDLQFVTERAAGLDVSLDERSGRFSVIALQGPHSREIMQGCFTNSRELPYYGFAEFIFAGRHCLVARLGYTGEHGYEIVASADTAPALWEELRSSGARLGLEECGFAAADTLRIEAGHILFRNELALRVTPFEVGFERLIDFYRESSPGLTALTELRAVDPAKRFVGLLFDDAVAPTRDAAAALAARYAAVTSACFSPILQRWIGLGFVPYLSRYPGTRVRLDGETSAMVARLPFYDPGRALPRWDESVVR